MTDPTGHTAQAPLAAGDRVWLIAPSGPAPEGTVEPAIACLEDWGLEVKAGAHLRSVDRRASYLAGSDAERSADLIEAWTDPDAAAVIALRGGFGAMRLIDGLDFDALAAAALRRDGRAKLLTGSSDLTALHQAWAHHLRIPTLFCPMVGNDVFRSSERIRTDVHRWLFSPWADQPVSLGEHAEALVPGEHFGITYGGNLSLLAAGLGSPEFAPGAPEEPGILILEDVDEEVYRLDNLLLQLKRAGWLARAGAVVLGSWENCGEKPAQRELLREYFADAGIPVVWEAELGHHPHAGSIPLGVPAQLTAGSPATESGAVSLTIAPMERTR
ncbi:LD-carboxypeptidase [Brevibacterium sp. p3-SID960]|uniref:S66 peptidase family protein n=1 Tax=Brevibacterium sp. p3-SID960 TaxID=2916063 RepID=UPI0021A49D19|nr:LD-carboxypeptidase [Brevibacterium sp. p3-SID960]MCT1690159.1 LD-carboxypeptidase [Brevibacterium sp. p3-SID960]